MRLGEVPKLAEGTPLERVQVVNAARGFKSLLLRSLIIKIIVALKNENNLKKLLTEVLKHDNIIKLIA